MKMTIVLLLATIFSLACYSQSTSKLITGLITSEVDSKPIEGAVVWTKGTKNYSGSQPDGIYYISVKPTDSVLVISSAGHERAEVRLNGQTEYNVTLKKQNSQPHVRNTRKE